MVLEQPGGPNIRTPLGGEIPNLLKLSGYFKGHSTDWLNKAFILLCPPMSVHLTFGVCKKRQSIELFQQKWTIVYYLNLNLTHRTRPHFF